MRRLLVGLLAASMLAVGSPTPARSACRPEPVTFYTPTGVAGCERWGAGIASHYGPGVGVAMNFCTWERRHSCGWVRITSIETGRRATAPVIDFCDCYTGTARERIVDLQWGVLERLGLDRAAGLYAVIVEPTSMLPDTATRGS